MRLVKVPFALIVVGCLSNNVVGPSHWHEHRYDGRDYNRHRRKHAVPNRFAERRRIYRRPALS